MTASPPAKDLIDHGVAAAAACADVLGRIEPADAARPTPCTEFCVADLTDHVARSMVLLAECAGTTLSPAPGGELAAIAQLAEATVGAWHTRGFADVVQVGSRRYPAELGYAIVPLELVVHGWDLSRAVGAEFAVDEALAEYLLTQAQLLITPERRGRGFAAAIDVPAGAHPLDRLIGFTGRPLG